MKGVELKRIDENNKGETTKMPKLILTIKDVKEPEMVLSKAKEIMKAVSQFAYTNTWPDDEEWKTILPLWFVESMTKKSSKDRDNDDNLWHFESWVANIKDRGWLWYSSKIEKNEITIIFELVDLPILIETMEYVFYAQGIPMQNISNIDEAYI